MFGPEFKISLKISLNPSLSREANFVRLYFDYFLVRTDSEIGLSEKSAACGRS